MAFDPYESLRALRGKLAICHARDARRAGASRAAAEVPVGHGDIDWLQMLGTFEEIEYRGWLTVKREEGANKLADVAGGMAFLAAVGRASMIRSELPPSRLTRSQRRRLTGTRSGRSLLAVSAPMQ